MPPDLAIPTDLPLVAGESVYLMRTEPAGMADSDVRHTVSVIPTNVDGVAAWRVVREIEAAISMVDEAVMRAHDLSPVALEGEVLGVRYECRVTGDVLHGEILIPPSIGGGPFDVPLVEPAFLSDECIWAMIAACPLDRDWSTSLHVLHSIEGSSEPPRFTPVRLRVVGEESVTVPAGEFACWIVSADGPYAVRERYWVSQGEPSQRVVVRARRHLDGPPPIYQFDLISPKSTAKKPEPAPPPPLSLTFRLRERRGDLRDVQLRPTNIFSPEAIKQLVDRSLATSVPSIDVMRASSRIPPGVPAAALERYESERQEYAEDMRAWLELANERQDRMNRRISLEIYLVAIEPFPTNVYVRITVPQRITVKFDGEADNFDHVQEPLALTVPLDRARKRFVARFAPAEPEQPAIPSRARFTATDGSTVVAYGPVSIPEAMRFWDSLHFIFPSWDRVGPFTITYDITSDSTEPLRGELFIGARRAPDEAEIEQ
jgi:hypothetical protein